MRAANSASEFETCLRQTDKADAAGYPRATLALAANEIGETTMDELNKDKNGSDRQNLLGKRISIGTVTGAVVDQDPNNWIVESPNFPSKIKVAKTAPFTVEEVPF